ncbi:MAG: hypothetical protein J7497_13595, partial [Chitinophagaceae bacterium]|nr:hypothetical protein [Chitinophagaceae bacterium]
FKKNISYIIEMPVEKARIILEQAHPEKYFPDSNHQSGYISYQTYLFPNGQILLIDTSARFPYAAIYADLKTIASTKGDIEEKVYGSDDDEHLMKRIAKGDRMEDFELNEHLIYPKYIKDVIASHQLTLVENNIFVSDFYGNLYQSAKGYYVLIDEVKQKNGAGRKMRILELRIYHSLSEVRAAQARYERNKNDTVRHEHFYQQISDRYGAAFPSFVSSLIDSLSPLLNINMEQVTIDSAGMDLVDEALQWNANNYSLFDRYFPAVLAYYGECYMKIKNKGEWRVQYNEEDSVWIPGILLKDGSYAFDWRDFYKSLSEGPVPLRWAGDWHGSIKRMRAGDK